ncbi:hypothetical protein ACIJYE_00665 [Candidatus Pelagibacter bacterium nBUS_30]|uniref:hypothetical protein n=1 Tax=Candidatus Pelagibacter bacterium nBUS_30 TaxID=3374191 RepID=UPI003EC08A90
MPTRIIFNIFLDIWRRKKAKKFFLNIKTNKQKRIFFFYDLKVSSISYGEFFYFCMLVRQLRYNGFNIKCAIIKDYIREDLYKYFSKIKIEKTIKELTNIFKFLNNDHIEIVNFKNSEKLIRLNDYVFLKKNYLKRKRIYEYFPLLNKETFRFFKNKNFLIKSQKSNIITYVVRFKYSHSHPERNQSIKDILADIEILRNKFPKDKIFLMTDDNSRKKLKTHHIIKKNMKLKKINFLKNKNFLDDLKILIKSRYFYSSTNTGLATINVFINRPGEFVCNNIDLLNRNISNDFFYPTQKEVNNFWPWLNKKIVVNFKSYYSKN